MNKLLLSLPSLGGQWFWWHETLTFHNKGSILPMTFYPCTLSQFVQGCRKTIMLATVRPRVLLIPLVFCILKGMRWKEQYVDVGKIRKQMGRSGSEESVPVCPGDLLNDPHPHRLVLSFFILIQILFLFTRRVWFREGVISGFPTLFQNYPSPPLSYAIPSGRKGTLKT